MKKEIVSRLIFAPNQKMEDAKNALKAIIYHLTIIIVLTQIIAISEIKIQVYAWNAICSITLI